MRGRQRPKYLFPLRCLPVAICGAVPKDALATPPSEQVSRLVTRPTAIEALVGLTSLQSLSLNLEDIVWDWDEDDVTSPSGQLTALAALTGLTELRLGGAPVSVGCATRDQ